MPVPDGCFFSPEKKKKVIRDEGSLEASGIGNLGFNLSDSQVTWSPTISPPRSQCAHLQNKRLHFTIPELWLWIPSELSTYCAQQDAVS